MGTGIIAYMLVSATIIIVIVLMFYFDPTLWKIMREKKRRIEDD